MLGLLQAYKTYKQRREQGSVSEYKPTYEQSSNAAWRRQYRHVNPPKIYGRTPYGHGVPQVCDVKIENGARTAPIRQAGFTGDGECFTASPCNEERPESK